MDVIKVNELPFDSIIHAKKPILLYDSVIIAKEEFDYGFFNSMPRQGFFVYLLEDDIQLNTILDYYNKTKKYNTELTTTYFLPKICLRISTMQ